MHVIWICRGMNIIYTYYLIILGSHRDPFRIIISASEIFRNSNLLARKFLLFHMVELAMYVIACTCLRGESAVWLWISMHVHYIYNRSPRKKVMYSIATRSWVKLVDNHGWCPSSRKKVMYKIKKWCQRSSLLVLVGFALTKYFNYAYFYYYYLMFNQHH